MKKIGEELEVTLLMPCLNEAETIGICVEKAMNSIKKNKLKGEVLIADNGSTDGSQKIATKLGARVVSIPEKGYGSALIGGTKEAKGKYIIMGDSDDSYDWSNIMPFVKELRKGNDLVMGNRFKGGIEKDAMPWSHKYIGTPVLSFLGRLFYKNKIGDFNCGMRGYNKESILKLGLICPGMEYASEMIVKSALNNYKIAEVPTTLKKDGRTRAPYLRSFSDGWRHLKFLIFHSPKWMFEIPAIMILLFLCVMSGLMASDVIPVKGLDLNNLITIFLSCLMISIQLLYFDKFTLLKLKNDKVILESNVEFSFEKNLILGVLLLFGGIIGSIILVNLRVIFSCAIFIGIEVMFNSLMIGIMNIEKK